MLIVPYFNSIKVRLKHDNVYTGRMSVEFQFHKGTIKTYRLIVLGLMLNHFNSIKVRLKRVDNLGIQNQQNISIP